MLVHAAFHLPLGRLAQPSVRARSLLRVRRRSPRFSPWRRHLPPERCALEETALAPRTSGCVLTAREIPADAPMRKSASAGPTTSLPPTHEARTRPHRTYVSVRHRTASRLHHPERS